MRDVVEPAAALVVRTENIQRSIVQQGIHYTAGHSFASFQPRKGRSFLRKIKNPNLRFDEVCCDSRNNLSEPAVGHGSDACDLAMMIRYKSEM